jgi:hypothetical protein
VLIKRPPPLNPPRSLVDNRDMRSETQHKHPHPGPLPKGEDGRLDSRLRGNDDVRLRGDDDVPLRGNDDERGRGNDGERQRGRTSRFRGVSWHAQSRTWRAQLQVHGKRKHAGSFDNEIEAAKAYDEAARRWHGHAARLNFPTEADRAQSRAPAGTIGRHEAMRRFGVTLKTWERWEREGTISCGRIVYLPSGGCLKVYPQNEIERLVQEFGCLRSPYPDPDRPGCYRVPLTGQDIHRREAIIDAASLPLVAGKRWCWCEGNTEGKGMVMHSRLGDNAPLRRIIMGVADRDAEDVQVAHANGDPLDLRRENLVLRSITERLASARKRKTHGGRPCSSRYKGVSWCGQTNKWKAYITKHGKTQNLGSFYDEMAAAEAYDEAANKLFGEHAWLNFPREGEQGRREDEQLQRAAA